ncbi:MAG: aminoglycoside phosphotransferase family protein [Deltaproteobacteria bacterium]|nr:aminoglycoside phosphotransferase family protein [Deltaproteobacteria bacterium]
MDALAFIREEVLPHFTLTAGAALEPLGKGLINQTFLVTGAGERFVLQRLAPFFSPAINDNIAAVTTALARAGLATPRLLPTRDGRTSLDLGGDGGVWRLQTYVPGVCFDKVQSPAQAAAAGALVGRFHRALDGLDHPFVGLREGVHDTARHLARLREAVLQHPRHRLLGQVGPLAEIILARAASLAPLPPLAHRICHGDLKLNNILFAGPSPPDSETAVCLIDLDTVGPMSLAHELGDAWRSWCNLSGEDSRQVRVDLDVLRASFHGYAGAVGRAVTEPERRALLASVEWISLELAGRFATDALNESYFGWDAQRYPGRGEHNLVRSRGQLALHEAFVASRAARAAILGL